MGNIEYRELMKSDLKEIKYLINDAFGFDEFIKNEKILDIVLESYAEECIKESSFTKVAIKEGKVIGVILAGARKEKINYSNLIEDKGDIEERLTCASEEEIKDLMEFMKIKEVYEELLSGKEKFFQGSINLFIVGKETRGFGVGKKLLSYVIEYMKQMDVKYIYLFTDTRCNYGFYDSQNFKCLDEKNLYIESKDYKLKTFIYGYKI